MTRVGIYSRTNDTHETGPPKSEQLPFHYLIVPDSFQYGRMITHMFDYGSAELSLNAHSWQKRQVIQPGSTRKYPKMQNKCWDETWPGTKEAQFGSTCPFSAAKDGKNIEIAKQTSRWTHFRVWCRLLAALGRESQDPDPRGRTDSNRKT